MGQRKSSKPLWEIKPQTFRFRAEVQFLRLTIFSLFHANDKTKNIFPYLFIKLKTCPISYSKDTYYITVFIERRKILVQTNMVFNLKGPLLKGLFKQVRTVTQIILLWTPYYIAFLQKLAYNKNDTIQNNWLKWGWQDVTLFQFVTLCARAL